MNSKTKKFAVVVLAIPFAISATTAIAAEPEDKEALHQAMENGNYQEWIELLPQGSELAKVVTAENFPKFAEAVNEMKDGDKKAAKAIFDELGLKKPKGPKGPGMHGDGEKGEKMEGVKAALEAGDYQAFLDAVPEDAPIREKITEENFAKMLEAHQLMESGDKEGAKAIMEELGIKPPKHRGEKNGQKFQQKEELMRVLESEDYQAWLELIPEDNPMSDVINEGNFGQFVEAHKLMKDDDFEGAKAIFDELGIEKPVKDGVKKRFENGENNGFPKMKVDS
ncbi:hypothetical protein ACFL21_00895 [Patescibacteria group bacterium]